MGVYVYDIALILVWAFSAALEGQTGKIEATRKMGCFIDGRRTYGVLAITDWGVDA